MSQTRSRSWRSLLVIVAVFFAGMLLLDALRPYLLSDPIIETNTTRVPVPTIEFDTESGTKVGLDDFAGRVVLINIWATWCPPCRDEMPSLDALQRALGGPDFEVVAISADASGAATIRAFYQELGIRSLAIYFDRTGTIVDELRIAGLPTTILVDRTGREIGRATGPADWSSDNAASLIKRHVQAIDVSDWSPNRRPGWQTSRE